MFKIGDKWMLLCISHSMGCRYYLGDFEDEQYLPEFHAMMNWHKWDCFAPESLLAPDGRRIMWAWIFDGRRGETRRESGWSGTMSLPRVIWLGDDHTLRVREPAVAIGRRQVRAHAGFVECGWLARLAINYQRLAVLAVRANGEVPLGAVREVGDLGSGDVAYVHIQGMGLPQVEIFERDLYAAASGKDAPVLHRHRLDPCRLLARHASKKRREAGAS